MTEQRWYAVHRNGPDLALSAATWPTRAEVEADMRNIPGYIGAVEVSWFGDALAAGRSKGLEEAAEWHDEQALGCAAQVLRANEAMTKVWTALAIDHEQAAKKFRALAASPGSPQPNTSGDD
jgi:hypothetical protein